MLLAGNVSRCCSVRKILPRLPPQQVRAKVTSRANARYSCIRAMEYGMYGPHGSLPQVTRWPHDAVGYSGSIHEMDRARANQEGHHLDSDATPGAPHPFPARHPTNNSHRQWAAIRIPRLEKVFERARDDVSDNSCIHAAV